MRNSSVPTIVVLLSWVTIAASAADPAKDPDGWASLRFGMSPKEVVDALGNEGRVVPLPEPEKPLPLTLSDCPDIVEAKKMAQELLSTEKERPGTLPPSILEACRELLAMLRSRKWTYTATGNRWVPGDPQKKAAKKNTITGAIESFSPDYPNSPIPNTGGRRHVKKILNIRVNQKTQTSLAEDSLEPSSREQIKKIEGLIYDIAMHQFPPPPAPDPSVIDPLQIKLNMVKIRGLTLTPEVVFDGRDKLSKVRMASQYAGEDGIVFDRNGMQRTLCEALEEKYGRPDEQNRTTSESHYIWRFPKTFLRCSSGEFRFDTGFVRKYVSITYEVPTEENAQGKEKL